MGMELLSVEALNAMVPGTAMASLGMSFVGMDKDWIAAKMPVDERTRQTHGVLHGGASVVLIESLGSIGSQLASNRATQSVFGMEVNANHLRAARSGYVTGTARPVHLGRTSHVWEVRLVDEAQRLTCIGRLTVAIVPKRLA